ncbi:protein SAWADEE HOMEODOMAIN HOMOLOG 1-like isoform X2 [Mangifera indica]|uniref:protein SAWADEE HOMEODOMAIN HOMOLOG 1-like isoform X2 n=1 Tax=Mangifera indica TaxID=29780 RepID=UPI001CFBBE48|nr:protein SAWADEE HOMEODOMAIN HOMOLOG 1-like isoform X2 [Mangifera indica]
MEHLESVEDSWPEFTLAEIKELLSTYKELGEAALSQEFCQALATSFSFSAHRAGRLAIPWQQVQSWFLDRLKGSRTKVQSSSSKAFNFFANLSREIFPSIERSRVSELKECQFEALSAKDAAWYDVASFLTYRVTHAGELEVRVRFSGFNHAEDEWVNVKEGVRERSIPLEPSECHRVNVGDLVLCYKEREEQAVYCDAYVVEIKRRVHDIEGCRCIFLVRYSHDYTEENVDLGRLCCRPGH